MTVLRFIENPDFSGYNYSMKSIIYPALVFLSVAAWGCLHSLLAAFRTKKWVRQTFGRRICRFYRLFYIFVAILTLTPILGMLVFLPKRVLWIIPPPWIYVTLIIQFLAILGILATILQTDVWTFMGIRQLENPKAEQESEFVRRGFYRIVRHPMYFFSIILFWLFPYMTDLILAFIVASTLYFLIGSIPEEQKLREIYGEAYEKYQDEVPRIIPGVKLT